VNHAPGYIAAAPQGAGETGQANVIGLQSRRLLPRGAPAGIPVKSSRSVWSQAIHRCGLAVRI